jgi:uncharacterized membrane protein YraQ (UPF0718 family)
MNPTPRKKPIGGWLFLLMVMIAYGVIGIIDVEIARQALGFFVKIMLNVLLALVIVFFLLLLVDLLIKPTWIRQNLGSTAGIKAWLIAAGGGVLATGPIYAWYTLLRELREKGMRASLATVFLYSRAIKLPLLPLMIHYFGITYTLVFCLYLLAFSIISGILMMKLEDRKIIP